jgi:hypothetical protein
VKHYDDVRTPADPEDFETTQSRGALPPVEFSIASGASANTFTIRDRQYPAQRAPTVAYRIYFLPAAFAPGGVLTGVQRTAGQRVASLVAEVKAPGRGADLTVTDTQFVGQEGYYYCVGVSRRELESAPEHLVKATG